MRVQWLWFARLVCHLGTRRRPLSSVEAAEAAIGVGHRAKSPREGVHALDLPASTLDRFAELRVLLHISLRGAMRVAPLHP